MRTIACTAILMMTLPALAAAAELEFPSRKPGQWEISMTSDAGAPPMSMTVCLDEATDREMMAFGMSMSESMCSTLDQTRSGDTITIDATCDMGGMKTTSHTVMTGNFDTEYNVVVTSSIEGGPPGTPANSTVNQTARWMGACSGGLQPGDMLMPGGMKMNLKDLGGMLGG